MSIFFWFFFTVSLVIGIILILIYLINIPTNDYEKHSAYECGFIPFGDARNFFNLHFYVVGLLFLVFDLEIVFLIPFVIDIENTSFFGFINFILFIAILLIGYIYEDSIGLLNWVPKKIFHNF